MDVKKVFEDTRPSVVMIMAYDDQDNLQVFGSGFFFGDSKTIATNLHVVKNASTLRIKLSNGEVGELTAVLGIDSVNDLALLRSTVTGKVLVGAGRLPDVGEDIVAIGNPKGLEGTVSAGIVSGIRTDETGQWVQITAPISPGSSGGPIVDAEGYVLGVTSFVLYFDEGQNLNFAYPTAFLTKLYNNRSEAKLSSLKVKSEKKIKKAVGSVKIAHIRLIHEGSYERAGVQFTVRNNSQEAIKNTIVKVTYFCPNKKANIYGCDLNDPTTPIHQSLFKVAGTVSPNSSLRYIRRSVGGVQNGWNTKAIIFDYDIIPDSSSGATLTFD